MKYGGIYTPIKEEFPVFMDCQMPEMDGYEASRTIRQLEKNRESGKRIPIIVVSRS